MMKIRTSVIVQTLASIEQLAVNVLKHRFICGDAWDDIAAIRLQAKGLKDTIIDCYPVPRYLDGEE